MRILGMDPGLASAGWSIIDYDEDQLEDMARPDSDTLFGDYKPELVKHGTIGTDSDNKNSDRVYKQFTELEKIVKFFDPDITSCEDQYAHLNPNTLKVLSHVRGAYMSILSIYDLECYLYYPTSVKKLITGSGNASKQDMLDSINNYFDLDLGSSKDDIADAISVSMSYLLNKSKGQKI